MQHEFRNAFAQSRCRFNCGFVTHVVGIFFLQNRIACLQNFSGCTPCCHLLDPNGLLTQAFFFFRHSGEGNLNLLIRLARELPFAFFTEINRCALDGLPHRGLLSHPGILTKVFFGNFNKAKHLLRGALPQKIQIHLRCEFIDLCGQLCGGIV